MIIPGNVSILHSGYDRDARGVLPSQVIKEQENHGQDKIVSLLVMNLLKAPLPQGRPTK